MMDDMAEAKRFAAGNVANLVGRLRYYQEGVRAWGRALYPIEMTLPEIIDTLEACADLMTQSFRRSGPFLIELSI